MSQNMMREDFFNENLQKFTAPIICEIANDGKSYTLEKSFLYYRKKDEKNARLDDENLAHRDFDNIPQTQLKGAIIVPKGFISDGFTNFGFDFIVPRFGKGLKCAILHDFLCECFHRGQNSRAFADSVFLEAMLETKAFSKFKAYLLYFLVRLFARIKGYK